MAERTDEDLAVLFPTFDFALFFLIVFTVSWSLRRVHGAHKVFMAAASYFFYGYWDWRFTFLLLGSSLLNYTAGRVLDLAASPRRRKWVVAAAVGLNLATLGFFKYYGFFMESLADLLFALGLERDLPFLEVILPVGISFFTFQGISYVVDVYRGRVPANRSLLNVVLYISFFPQLVAGPIVRASYFLPQLDQRPDPGRILAGMGLLLILWGVFKKAIVANYLAVELVDDVFFDPTVYHPLDLLLALYGYSVQLYCDFSAYSDIAIGAAALLGYRFPRNFDQPWRSESVGEFWQRWHLSLSTWLRDYLFIPLGGSRGGRLATSRNILITMFLGGVWHGAGYTYVLWSLYQSLGLALERLWQDIRGPVRQTFFRRARNLVLFFHFFAASWILFRVENLEVSRQFLAAFGNWEAPITGWRPLVLTLIALGLAANFTPPRTLEVIESRFVRLPAVVQGLLVGFILVMIEAFGMEGMAPFIYFQF
ncbi:MAG: MBOAT family O-acyltransferase [Thermodesulfobacteriota bacterium]